MTDAQGSKPAGGRLALVLSGGGARAAYQVGFLQHVARTHPALRIDIVTGVSAGAINAAFLAARSGTFAEKVGALAEAWKTLTLEEVFRVDPGSLAFSGLRWGLRLLSGGGDPTVPPKGMVDTEPLWTHLETMLGAVDGNLLGIDGTLRSGDLTSIAITGASYSTGQSVTWVQGEQMQPWDRPLRKSVRCNLRVAHVMASAALPLFFPAVQVEGRWYGDGGIRLSTPLSPAIHLGAERIIAVSTRYQRTRLEEDTPYVSGYPPPAQVLGVLLNSVFLDVVDQDAIRLERINRLVSGLPESQSQGMRPVRLLQLRPSRDVGRLVTEYEPRLPRSFRFLTRGLGTRETRSNDVLSLLMFQGDYLSRLIEPFLA
jgi:NTE family protein